MSAVVSQSPEIRISPLLRAAFCALGICALLLVVISGYQSSGPAIRRIELTGSLEHVSAEDIRQLVAPYLGEAFMATRVDRIQRSLEAAPWIAAARVERSWPDALAIRVWEHEAVARWSSDAVLSRSGAVFRPAELPADLPMLSGPDDQAVTVWQAWADMSLALGDTPFDLQGLNVDARGSWTGYAAHGLELRFGRGDPRTRVETLRTVVGKALAAEMRPVKYIDLRYDNGFAVGWSDESKTTEVGADG